MLLFATPFNGGQLALIIVIAAVVVLLAAANGLILFLLHRKKQRSKLCTPALQRRREELLEELNNLRNTDFVSAADADEDEADEPLEDEPDEEEQDDIEGDVVPEGAVFSAEIMAVRDMSDEMRQKFGFIGLEYRRKQYYVRATYSFEARLRSADYAVKRRYAELCDELARYKGVAQKRSFRQERAYIGRKTIALMLMRGKTLCIAIAADPKQYQDTKYRGIDVSDRKRFANTPMLIKITSERRLSYAKYLLGLVAEQYGAKKQQLVSGRYDLAAQSLDDLFAANLVKLTVLGEADELAYLDDESAEVAAAQVSVRAGILHIRDMTDEMIIRLGLLGHEFDNKSYYVRYNYGFEAKLRSASDEMKQRYVEFVDELGWYKKVKLNKGFRQQTVRYGNKTLCALLFKGKTLCIAFALDPDEYKDTKYRGIDVRDVKRFAKTPMLLKITSKRRLFYAKYLLNRMAEDKLIEMNHSQITGTYDLTRMSMGEMFAKDLLKIKIIGEVPKE